MRSLLLIAAFAFPALASAQIVRPTPPPRPWPCRVPPPCVPGTICQVPACGIQSPDVYRTRSDVKVDLTDGVLRYEVSETFYNRGSRVGEADYMFPLPKGAAFQDLKLSINGEMIAGETMSADRARRIYEEIVRSQRDPALLEWMGYGLFRARIFPIAPGEEKKVVLRFHVVSRREGDAIRVDYFRGLGNTQTASNQPLGGKTSFVLTYPNDPSYGMAYSPTHSIESDYGSIYSPVSMRSDRRGSTRRVEVRDARGEITLLIPVRRSAAAAISLLANAPGNDDGFALITLSPPAISPRAVPRDLTFVLDVSGSMSGEKIEQARAAGKQFLRSLSAADRFRLIDFSSDVRTFRDGFSYATRENLRAAERYLDELEAQGSTNISGALDEALSVPQQYGRLPIVLFLTDGLPTVGERDGAAIASSVAKRRGSRRVFTFGVGSDLNIPLIEQLALEGRGTASFVRPEESVERAVSIVASRLTNPLVTDVRVRADGVRLLKMHPSGPVDIFAGEDLVILARYDGSGDAVVRFEGQTSSGPVSWGTRVQFPERSRENAYVARLWATQRVGYLSAEKRKHGRSRELDDEIRELGERYGIPTEFSSYLVLEPGMNPQLMDARRVSVGRGAVRRESSIAGGNASGVAVAAPSAPPSADLAFEAAKTSSAQRAVTNMAAIDSLSGLRDEARIRRLGNMTFLLKDGVWTDANLRKGAQVLRVKPFSEAYFKVIEMIPELREAFALSERLIVSGRTMTIELTAEGKETLSERDQVMLRDRW